MNSWFGNALTRAEAIDDWLHEKRAASLALLRDTDWPTRQTEAWKYTSLKKLEQLDFSDGSPAPVIDVSPISGLNSINLVFIDGVLQSIPADLPEGLTIMPLAQVPDEHQPWVLDQFAGVKPQQHLFGLINDTLATNGLVIDVAPHVDLKHPIHITQTMTAGNEAHCRTLVRVGAGARVTVIEHLAGNQESFNTSFTEYSLATKAELEHYRLALQSDAALTIGGSHFNLDTQATLNSTIVGYGSDLARIDVDISHQGEGTLAKLDAIYLLDKQTHFDLHSNIEHTAPNGTSDERVRGIVADKARAVFNGRIHIHRYAQKTSAELNNRNLLLSRDAEVDVKPELEIYADDVSCAHGATIAEIDQLALYYLRSRGIGLEQAHLMLNFGFINELIDQIPNAVLADWLRQQLSGRFTRMNEIKHSGQEATQ